LRESVEKLELERQQLAVSEAELNAQLAKAEISLDKATKRLLEKEGSLIVERSGDISGDRKKLLEEVNQLRAQAGLEPLPRPDHWLSEDEE
jgi:hypothetical protein